VDKATSFTSTEQYEAGTIEKCVSGLQHFSDWCEKLSPRDARRFTEVHSFARCLIASIYRQRPRLEAIDEEALGKLFL
jgi:hypothetical protein